MPPVAIIGLGYVGLPLSLQFARTGTSALGLDIDSAKIAALKAGQSYIAHIPAAEIQAQVAAGRLTPGTDFAALRTAGAIIVCVPTPLNKYREPDHSYVVSTAEAIAPHLQRGTLVVLESTTYPGTTDGEFRAALEAGSGLKAGADFHLAFSPEREDPGNPQSELRVMPKLVGGFTPACTEKACALYAQVVKQVVPVSSCRVAEAAKLLENIFRSVNIALVNELKVVYAAMGIDIWEVIAAAKTKPFGFMPFYPGPGLGGHCIPIDPFYLTWKAREFGQHTRFIELAGEINTAMPHYVMSRAAEALNARRRAVNGSRVLLLGLAYKPNVDDQRESPTFALMELLTHAGATVDYHDPHIPVIKPTREHAAWTGRRSVAWNHAIVSGYDLVIISTAHAAVNYGELGEWAQAIVDTRNAMAAVQVADRAKVWKA
jgi:UDP-N-acetyl-D-glucosamine dehydrogenase